MMRSMVLAAMLLAAMFLAGVPACAPQARKAGKAGGAGAHGPAQSQPAASAPASTAASATQPGRRIQTVLADLHLTQEQKAKIDQISAATLERHAAHWAKHRAELEKLAREAADAAVARQDDQVETVKKQVDGIIQGFVRTSEEGLDQIAAGLTPEQRGQLTPLRTTARLALGPHPVVRTPGAPANCMTCHMPYYKPLSQEKREEMRRRVQAMSTQP